MKSSGEPCPRAANRRAILAYEATEGGAGVLNQLIEDPQSLAGVAREALALMHYDKVDEAIAAGDHTLLIDREGEACVRGCYRCLLSYFNQPDHEMIDRVSPECRQMLIDIAKGTVVLAPQRPKIVDPASWPSAFKTAGIPAPDVEPVTLAGGCSLCLALREGPRGRWPHVRQSEGSGARSGLVTVRASAYRRRRTAARIDCRVQGLTE